MKKFKAVITADIVNSSMLSKKAFTALLKSFERQFTGEGLKFGFYRGDSFHALCGVNAALRLVCLLRTAAIQYSTESTRIDIRITIGIGTVEEPVKDLGTARGDAFTLSGREMDQLEKSGPRLSIRCKDAFTDTGFSAISLFMDYILNKMTVKQAEVVHILLHGLTQAKVAKKLGKTQSTVSKHASSANWNELVRLLEIYDDIADLSSNEL
jgi:hypothetical protein